MSRYIEDIYVKCAKVISMTDEETDYGRGWNASLDAVLENAPTAAVIPLDRVKQAREEVQKMLDELGVNYVYEEQWEQYIEHGKEMAYCNVLEIIDKLISESEGRNE